MKVMRTQVLVFAFAGIAWVAASSGAGAQDQAPKQPAKDWAKGYIAAPPGTETLTAELESPSIQLFANANFQGTEATLSRLDKINPQGKANDMPNKELNDGLSSVRWSLPRGAVVIFYEDAAPKGEQLILWGTGQMAELSRWNFNDKASRWAWFNIGGRGTPLQGDATTIPPIGSESLGIALVDNSIQLFKDKNFANDMKQVSPVTSVKAGELQKLPAGLDDDLTSLQWTLPDGVIVLLYEDANGQRDRVAIWGKGQLSDLAANDFNDKASRWSWAYIGEPAKP